MMTNTTNYNNRAPYSTASGYDSFERAYAQLHRHCTGRVRQGLTQTAVIEQCSREAGSVHECPDAYRFGEIMALDIRNEYRSGMYNGKRIMTVEDVSQLYFDQTGRAPRYIRSSVSPDAPRVSLGAPLTVPTKPAAPYRVLTACAPDGKMERGRREDVFTERGRMPAIVEKKEMGTFVKALSKFNSLINSDRDSRVVKAKRRIGTPAAALALVLIFALVLILPITMSTLVRQAANDVNDLDRELSVMQSKADDLRTELDAKNDLRLIEDLAVNRYGMIRLAQSTSRYLKLNTSDVIESFDSNDGNRGAVFALLSALGLRVGS